MSEVNACNIQVAKVIQTGVSISTISQKLIDFNSQTLIFPKSRISLIIGIVLFSIKHYYKTIFIFISHDTILIVELLEVLEVM